MGSGRDKRKKQKGHKPGVGAEKTARKTEKNALKDQRRLEKKAQGGEDDIDALLAQFKIEDESAITVTIEEDCAPPSPRVYSSFHQLNDKEIIMFGGEWLDSDKDRMYVYADIYILDTEKLKWKRIISPGGPMPRTSHQAVVTRAYMYVFGGEFTSVNQKNFKHYSDLWRLDLSSWEWEKLPTKGGPSARSGHRMVLLKGKLLLFGGFYDAGKETKYYNDLWCFDLEEFTWECLGPKPGSTAPAPRGGCQLAVHQESNTMYLIGGYSVKYSTADSSTSTGAKRKSSKGDDDDIDDGKGIVHDDVWALDLKEFTWERIKKAGMAPTPRTSFGVVTHKGRAILFGGVHDREGAGDRMYSELFNEIYQFNMASRRWFPLAIRPAKLSKKEKKEEEEESSNSAATTAQEEKPLPPGVSPEMHAMLMRVIKDKDSALVKAATRIQAAYRGHVVRSAYTAYKLGGQVSELLYSPATYGIDLSSTDMIKPRARSAPMLAVLKNTMWMFGGMVEIGHTDVVLDDLWSLDLNKVDGWKCVKENSVGENAFKELSDEEWETDDEDE